MSAKRDPVFTEGDYKKMQDVFPYASLEFVFGAKAMMDIYEAKITSGELRVVKGAALVRAVGGEHYTAPAHCSLCGIRTEYYDEDEQPSPIPNYCPGCGAKINA
jgi:hypothetical protein